MNDRRRYFASIEHEKGLEHDSTMCWVCTVITEAVRKELEKNIKAIKDDMIVYGSHHYKEKIVPGMKRAISVINNKRDEWPETTS